MTTCTKCAGGGLTGGNPDAPHEQVGEIKTCDACNGTGQIQESNDQAL